MNTIVEILLNIIVSIVLLYTLHCFWEYLKDTYSVRKKKNLVETQMHKYKQIMSEMTEPTPPHVLSDNDIRSMNDELIAFMEQQPITDSRLWKYNVDGSMNEVCWVIYAVS